MDIKESSFASTLGSPSKKTNDKEPSDIDHTDFHQGSFLEITLNPPRVKRYTILDSRGQQKVLLAVLRSATKKFNCKSEYTYEYCKDGIVHMHAYILMLDKGIICGLVNDVAKTFIRCFKQCPKPEYYTAEWKRYRAPCCVVQWRPSKNDYWVDYMNKQQDKEASSNKFASAFGASPNAVTKPDLSCNRKCILKYNLDTKGIEYEWDGQ